MGSVATENMEIRWHLLRSDFEEGNAAEMSFFYKTVLTWPDGKAEFHFFMQTCVGRLTNRTHCKTICAILFVFVLRPSERFLLWSFFAAIICVSQSVLHDPIA